MVGAGWWLATKRPRSVRQRRAACARPKSSPAGQAPQEDAASRLFVRQGDIWCLRMVKRLGGLLPLVAFGCLVLAALICDSRLYHGVDLLGRSIYPEFLDTGAPKDTAVTTRDTIPEVDTRLRTTSWR